MTESFDQIKEQILKNLQTGLDFSPKGSVDIPVRDFVHFLNFLPHYVTTSSCSGRISVCYPGHEDESKGVIWTLVKHGFVSLEEVHRAATTVPTSATTVPTNGPSESAEITTTTPPVQSGLSQKYTTFKCEPFIMHICCRSIVAAKTLHQLAMECGFRESGVTIGNKKVMVAIRTTSYHMELPIATKAGQLLFPESYLDIVVKEANDRLQQNFIRISKLLQQLKSYFQFPTLSVLPFDSVCNTITACNSSGDGYLWQRFGHSVVPRSQLGHVADFLVLGGQGVESSHHSKSSRHVIPFSWKEYQSHQKNPKVVVGKSLVEVQVGVHAAALVASLPTSPATHVLLISGGRHSPAKPQPCLTLYKQVQSIDAKTKKVESKYVAVEAVLQTGDCEPAARWGHCFVQVTENKFFLAGGRDEHRIFDDCYFVTITEQDGSFAVHWQLADVAFVGAEGMPQRNVFRRCFASSCILYSLEESQYNDKDGAVRLLLQGGLVDLQTNKVSADCFVVNFATKAITQPTLRFVGKQEEERMSLKRMGHHMISLPGKTLLLTGGTTDEYDAGNVQSLATTRLDLVLDARGQEVIEYSAVSGLPPLTCQQCRTHHQTISFHPDMTLSPQKMLLLLAGGGMMSLAFGDHLCSSVLLEVGCGNVDHLAQDDSSTVAASSRQSKKAASSSSLATDEEEDVLMMLLVPSSKVKTCKSFLEQRHWLNKTQKICKVTNMSELVHKVETLSLMPQTASMSSIDAESMMGVPVEHDLVHILRSKEAPDAAVVNELQQLLSSTSLQLVRGSDVVPFDARVSKTVAAAPSSSSSSTSAAVVAAAATKPVQQPDQASYHKKAACQTPQMKMHAYLADLATKHNLPASCLSNIPSKYELVGNILMIPDGTLEEEAWQTLIAQNDTEFWEGMIACYGKFGQHSPYGPIQRVARKAFVHSGPMRKSQIQMLYVSAAFATQCQLKKYKQCRCGEDHSTLPGWVTVLENQVKFSFDITKVMFCSGNNTERMRMGSLRIPQETVVDFYCGIGYYTVPILKYGQPKHHYALEWNPDSVYALRHNLTVAGVPPERYSIYFGDNQVTSVSLIDIADRILLGLLPSSVPGWPLAARALSKAGGMIHVHENVMETDFPVWVEDMRAKFAAFLQAANKPMSITIQHVEIVKSYAPRVYHYVVDLHCVPLK